METRSSGGYELIGRDRELAAIDSLLASGASSSRTLILIGDPGIGKTALLTVAAARGASAGYRVLSAAGVEVEQELAFAGLHQLLRPVLPAVERLPVPQAAALRCAFGLDDSRTPDRFLIGLATLSLLAEVADEEPVLVTVDDPRWLDRSSVEALAFAHRRFEAERVAVIIASFDEESVNAFGVTADRLVVEPLDDEAARLLLDSRASPMDDRRRAHVLAEAAGNPLALIELASPSGAGTAMEELSPAGTLRPTARLSHAFAGRLAHLPPHTRRFLTLAAAADGTDVRPILRAAQAEGLPDDATVSAELAGLISVDANELHFRHPLVRSVVYGATPFAERRAAHLALAAALADDPDRRAWHLAAVIVEPDEAAAAALEASADRSRARAGFAASARALERAADLSPAPAEQARRLVLAEVMAVAAGRAAWVEELYARVRSTTADPELLARAMVCLAYVQALGGRGSTLDVISIPTLEAVMRDAPAVGIVLLIVAAGYSALTGDYELGAAAERLVRQVPGPGDEPWRLLILASGNPAANGREVASHLPALMANPPDQPEMLMMAGMIPWHISEVVEATELLTKSVERMRTGGYIGALPSSLPLLGFIHLWRGRWVDATALAAETVQMAGDAGQPAMAALAHALHALVAALQGDAGPSRDHARSAIAMSDARLVVGVATWAVGLVALGDGRFQDADDLLRQIFAAGNPAAHRRVARWAIADLVEAAVRSGRANGLGPLVEDLGRQADATASVGAVLVARRAKALLAADDDADELFRAALATEGRQAWPFETARTRLVYGEWLRRRRQIVVARPVLRAAFEAFTGLGAAAWAERAQAELRAAGASVALPPSTAADELTPQQRQIARMAAEGLTNREIGALLFLSPRTIGFHLSNVFPKLQVTTRAQLARALGDLGPATAR
ncbi:MAG TPA: LuxR C-terminal-related transcriptional regulator [Terriglobales bacterium]|nr:LuxR C-terminal-related transcriptional regulator [Terriglobales bacterium]